MSYQMNNQNEMNYEEILNTPINLLNDFNYEINIIEDDDSDTVEYNNINNIIEDDDSDTVEYNDINNINNIIETNIYQFINIIEYDEDEETIHEMEVTEEMKIEYCSSYVQHIYCFLKQAPGEINFDLVCETQFGGNVENCALIYLKNYILNIWNFDTWLFDFAYGFPDSTNFLNHFIQEISVDDLMDLLNTSLPNEENL
jgi:hypothetical protein